MNRILFIVFLYISPTNSITMKTLLLLCMLSLGYTTQAADFPLSITIEGSELITMRIQANKVACDGFEGNKTCFMVQKGASIGTDFWEPLKEPIDGFNFEAGFSYDLQIKIELRENPNADQSQFQYHLVKIISKTKV